MRYEAETLQFLRDAAIDGTEALKAARNTLPTSANKEKLWTLYGEELKKAAAESDVVMGGTTDAA